MTGGLTKEKRVMGQVDRPNKYPLLTMGTSSGQRLKSSVAGS